MCLIPFGGIGSTGILGAYEGYQVVCCELEPAFVALAKQNFDLHAKKLAALGCPLPVIIQGDSCRLCDLVARADCIVASPPYAATETCGNRKELEKYDRGEHRQRGGYTDNPQNLGNLKLGDIDCVISSPPYERIQVIGGSQVNRAMWGKGKDLTDGASGESCKNYIGSEGQLGNLKPGDVQAIISSPPYEGQVCQQPPAGWRKHLKNTGGEDLRCGVSATYATQKDNLSNQHGDTFWGAAKTILEQCYAILKPGGAAIWVLKSYVHKHKIVDFPRDWRKLCEAVGFKTLHQHHASLVQETHDDTFFGTETKRKEKKSFFRRLSEKRGSPKIDFELILCSQKKY